MDQKILKKNRVMGTLRKPVCLYNFDVNFNLEHLLSLYSRNPHVYEEQRQNTIKSFLYRMFVTFEAG